MKKTRELLMADYNKSDELMVVLDQQDERRKVCMKKKDDIRNELIKLEQIEMEAKMKEAEIKAEDKREKIRNGITIGTFAVTSLISIWAVMKTFKFDSEGTVTSTLGRGILSGIIPKFKK